MSSNTRRGYHAADWTFFGFCCLLMCVSLIGFAWQWLTMGRYEGAFVLLVMFPMTYTFGFMRGYESAKGELGR